MKDQRVTRRLAAILAADVVGFSRMMGEDETGTLLTLDEVWKKQFNPKVEEHSGRIVKMMGDGALVEFASAVDAVECAVAIQKSMTKRNKWRGSQKLVEFRIGVNLGDIIIQGDDIFGEGVNVAARLESQAPHGGVLISDVVFNQVNGKVDPVFLDAGKIDLKNIKQPVNIWIWSGSSGEFAPKITVDTKNIGSRATGQQAKTAAGATFRTHPADDVNVTPAKVVIPTTGGCVWIEGLRKRPRLKASYAALKGDFRPLGISEDYHRFTTGPLLAIMDDVPHELSLSSTFDSGRSWEFPVLIAHLLAERGKLLPGEAGVNGPVALPKQEGRAAASGQDLIWATGMVDPELRPIAGDYKLDRKLNLSQTLFEKTLAGGGKVTILLPASLPESDRRKAKTLADDLGLAYHEVGDLPTLQKTLGIIPLPQGTPPNAEADQDFGTLTVPARRSKSRPLLIGACVGTAALLAIGYFASDRSTPIAVTNSDIAVEALFAESRMECHERVWSNEPLIRRVIDVENGRIRLPLEPGFCGLRMRNVGEKPLFLTLDNALEEYSIPGHNPLFQVKGSKLASNESITFVLGRQLDPMTARLKVNAGSPNAKEISLEFTKGGSASNSQ